MNYLGLVVVCFTLSCTSTALYAQTLPPKAACRIGFVTVTHGKLGEDVVWTAEQVLGEQQSIRTVSIEPHDDMTERRNTIIDDVKALDAGCGVIIFTDFFGGTPSNLAISVMDGPGGKIEVLAGLNLPMFIKALSMRESNDLVTTANTAVIAGQRYVERAKELLKPAQNDAATQK